MCFVCFYAKTKAVETDTGNKEKPSPHTDDYSLEDIGESKQVSTGSEVYSSNHIHYFNESLFSMSILSYCSRCVTMCVVSFQVGTEVVETGSEKQQQIFTGPHDQSTVQHSDDHMVKEDKSLPVST